MTRNILSSMIFLSAMCSQLEAQQVQRIVSQISQNDSVQMAVVGTLKRFEKFPSQYIEARHVDVWLPPDYETKTSQHYAVLYMHDGQNLFDPKQSFIGVDWAMDETMTKLLAEQKIRPTLVVGIWNSPKRRAEYMPEKAFALLSEAEKAKFVEQHGSAPFSNRYLQFLVSELKPFIDSTFRTLPERENTFIMGSSMGGLISLYAICEYPHIFGGAGCLSTHFPIGNGIMIDYMKTHLPEPATHKIYFDYGTETLDKDYEPYQQKADAIMREKGFTEKNWITQKFIGDEHSERAWRKRVHLPLLFLLGRKI
ncbi:MAG: esterase [[Chlorobium] sp. 445]|nr:MAG: esterase [[Chlorobium] sp. 445]